MSKLDSKVSIKHYLNKKLKPTYYKYSETDTAERYPVYIQVTYKRKSKFFKSKLVNEADEQDLLESDLVRNKIKYEQNLINQILDELATEGLSIDKYLDRYNFYTQKVGEVIFKCFEKAFTDNRHILAPELSKLPFGELVTFFEDFCKIRFASPPFDKYLFELVNKGDEIFYDFYDYKLLSDNPIVIDGVIEVIKHIIDEKIEV